MVVYIDIFQEPIPVSKHRNKDDNSCSHNFLNSSLPSTNINMSETYTPNFVYKRRKIQRNSSSVLPLSQNSTPTFVYKRRKVQKKPSAAFTAQVSTNTRASDSCFSAYSPEAVDGASLQHEPMSEDDPKIKIRKVLDLYAVNDNYSSSKSNKDLDSASMKLQVDDVGECSSSGALIMEGFEKDISKKNACISFLRHHGVLERSLRIKTRSQKLVSVRRSCKVCMQSETTLNMLICDLCEESFHVFCCDPSKVCAGEWFCDSCLRKKLKKLKAINSRKLTKDSGPIASMLRDADSYTSNVRIGKDFQAEVPDWSDPVINDHNDYGEHAEISPLECSGYQDWSSNKLLRLSSIGNWLQCREVIDGDGTICGKWRRAPLFEVQTDAWECFRSVLWDPAHADCAVPQELDTDQVLKHLKYIEMLRPRLAAKRCKLGVNKGVDSQ